MIGTVLASTRRSMAMRNLLLLLTLPILNFCVAQGNFPPVQGETAAGAAVNLPDAGTAKYIVVGLAYSQKAQPALEEWFEPAYLRFVAKHGLFAGAYDVDVFFVPLFTGLNKAAYEPSLRKFRKSAAPEIVDHVVFSKADVDPLKSQLGLDERDVPYFFVVDRTGRILHRTQGAFSEDKLEAIEEVLMR